MHCHKRSIIASVFVIFLFVFTCLATACQPTPDENIVLKRDAAETIIRNSSISNETPYDYEIPLSVNDRFEVREDQFDVAIDASVDAPPIGQCPVARAQRMQFETQYLEPIVDYFVGDGELVTPYIPTKQDYEEWIINEKLRYHDNGANIDEESFLQTINELEIKKKQAPIEDVCLPIHSYSIEDGTLNARVIKDNNTIGTIIANETRFCFISHLRHRPSTIFITNPTTGIEEKDVVNYHIEMTEEDAKHHAEDMLSSLGINNFKVCKVSDIYFYNKNNKAIEFGGYTMIFLRSYGGMIPKYITEYWGNPKDSFDYVQPIATELIQIDIDEFGCVQGFSWQNPIKIVDTMTQNVELLPFEQILQRLKDYAKHHWTWHENTNDTSSTKDNTKPARSKDVVCIDNISLNLSYLPMKNNTEEFMLVPCWVFTYHYTSESTTGTYQTTGCDDSEANQYMNQYIILNAIDGGTISVYPADFAHELGEQEDSLGVIQLPISNSWK